MTNEELALRAQAGDLDARNQLWEAVRRLCYKLAHRFFPLCQRAGIERADLEQELFFGFLAALDAFDPDKGYLFNSYLEYTVRKACANVLGIRNGKRLDPPASLQTPVGEDCDELQDLIPDTTSGKPFEDAENRVFIAIFKIKAYSRMNGTNLHSPVELQPEMHAESHLEEHPMSLL